MDFEMPHLPNKLNRLNELKQRALTGGGEQRIHIQHERGKLTARERLTRLLDDGSFEEFGSFVLCRTNEVGLNEERHLGDAVVTGSGKIAGRRVFVFAQDFTVLGGSISEVVGLRVGQLLQLAMENLAPVIAIFDSGGARIQEGVMSLAGVGNLLCAHTLASGVVPQISIVAGPSAGGAAYGPAITDFTFMIQGISQMYITGPEAIKTATHTEISHQELGGALVHASQSGVAHFLMDTEDACFCEVRRLLSFLPQNWREKPPQHLSGDDPARTDVSLRTVIPEAPNLPYDMKKIISSIVDSGDFLEVHQYYASNILVGYARLDGQAVGIIAQQPAILAGAIDINASDKAARFIRCCDAFNIPLVSLVDAPGFLPGTAQEHSGIIRHGAKLIFAYAEATVPKISVIVRKAYGGAYIVMSSKHLRGDINLAWPGAEIAVMGASGAVSIISRRAITTATEPENERRKLIREYEEKFNNPYIAAARGYIDDVIDPAETRPKIIRALEMLKHKNQQNPLCKHSCIPL
ncbi:MAG: acyl-CoA carboxylase subunit beta [Dehalococcoidia bacterium]|nr:acyl-CoA carboxylase subunit beta [Dehalococcoidia bacterium]